MDPFEKVATFLILFAIPYFYGLIGVEILYAKWKGKKVYRLNDSITDINMGVLDRTVDLFVRVGMIGTYILCYRFFHLFEVSLYSPWAWGIAFVLVDFCFYWAHRMCHQINFLWACHVVHHSSEEMNLTVALHQSATESLFTWAFYLPLAFIGFPWTMWVICFQINLLYQFWVHTQMVGKLGAIEWVMNTPSHHRVHHGADEKYIDKNHAGVFIVWDRLFGTFQEEKENPTYGIVTPLRSWNPFWGHLHYWVRLFRLCRSATHLKDKILIWFKSPPWLPEGVEGTPPDETVRCDSYRKFDVFIGRRLATYTFLQFLTLLGLVSGLMFMEGRLQFEAKVGVSLFVLWTLLSVGGLLEKRRWVFYVELIRLPSMLLFLSLSIPFLVESLVIPTRVLFGILALVYLTFLIWLLTLKKELDGTEGRELASVELEKVESMAN